MPVATSKRKAVVLIVFVALLLDNILVTCIVPILPNYLRQANDPPSPSPHQATTLTPRPSPRYGIVTHTNQSFTLPRVVPDHTSNSTDSEENTRMGFLIGTKTFVQLFANFGVGYLTNRVGYTIPMFCGFIILVISTSLFAFANTYHLLLTARAIQGIGTAMSTTSGMGLLAELYPDQKERGLAQTIAFSGLAAGVLVGPPYGGILYHWTGSKEIPLLILAGVSLLEGVLQMIVIRPRYQPEEKRGSSFTKLMCDPYILVTVVSITLSSLTVAVLEPVLPIWMYYTMDASAWLQGVAFIPHTLSYLLFLQIFGILTHRYQGNDVSHRWVFAFIGSLLLGCSISAVPFCGNIYGLIVPLTINGLGLALVSSSMLPHIGYLVDQRHEPVYGSAYALTDNAFCLSFAIDILSTHFRWTLYAVLGPAISGPMVDTIGFAWTLICLGTVCVLAAPCVCFLRKVSPRHVNKATTGVTERMPLLDNRRVAFTSSANQAEEIDN